MKYILIALLVIFNAGTAVAQKHNLFADLGTSFDGPGPGGSLTYNYKLLKRFGLGIGVQGYSFSPSVNNADEFTPAMFGDIRLNSAQRKKHFFFYFLDLGINFYAHKDVYKRSNNIIYNVPNDNGFYTGLGIGYFRRVTKGGWGPYASLKIISNSYKVNEFNLVSREQHYAVWDDATLALSVGFKF